MARSTKLLGSAVLAALAISAAIASAAQANRFMSAGDVGTSVHALQSTTHKLTTLGSSVTCETAEFNTAGEEASPTMAVTVHPVYKNCTAYGFPTAEVTTTGCNYVVTVGPTIGTEGGGLHYEGTLHLECEKGKKIIISAGTCEASISGPQEFPITITNVSGTPEKVKVSVNVSNIKTFVGVAGFLCPLAFGAKESSFVGDTVAEGKHSGSTVGITVEFSF